MSLDPTATTEPVPHHHHSIHTSSIARRMGIGALLVLVGLAWTHPSLAQKPPAPRGELRIVDKAGGNWSNITFNVMDHLVELDKDGKLVPRLATSWRWLDENTLEMKLRHGVRVHNGEVFDAEIVKLNWEENTRLRQPHAIGQFMNFKPGSSLQIMDLQTVRFI